MANTSEDNFYNTHKTQLEALNVPTQLWSSLEQQLQSRLVENTKEAIGLDESISSIYGSLIVVPHICQWNIQAEPSRGLWDVLWHVPQGQLEEVLLALDTAHDISTDKGYSDLKNAVCSHACLWAHVSLYVHEQSIWAALLSPPYPKQNDEDPELIGPLQFYYQPKSDTAKQCSLYYAPPESPIQNRLSSLTLDVAPSYYFANCHDLNRAVRYVGLLGPQSAPQWALQAVREAHVRFIHEMHLARQHQLERLPCVDEETTNTTTPSVPSNQKWKIYTDPIDPFKLKNKEGGLNSPHLELVESIEDADYIYSSLSLYSPSCPYRTYLEHKYHNQFPYEAAFCGKDHLGREILKQHGLPRPSWALETYDLDVQLAHFVASSVQDPNAMWIIKPARGTRSQGHVVTRNMGHVIRLLDSDTAQVSLVPGIPKVSRVAQRYIEYPMGLAGKKVDCRCLVVLAHIEESLHLYVHNRMFFRVASKPHTIKGPSDWVDEQSVLTAMHLVTNKDSNDNQRPLLAPDYKVIAQMEKDYGFNWSEQVLPKIYILLTELFRGMTEAYPAMKSASNSRALYGIDIIFDAKDSPFIEPKLTEVSFCPSNNALAIDAYEKDQELFDKFSNNLFECLVCGITSPNMTQLF